MKVAYKLTLLVRDLPAPFWMTLLLKHLTNKGIEWEMLAWKGAMPEEKNIPFHRMHKLLHRIFRYHGEREPFQSYQDYGNLPYAASAEELCTMLEKETPHGLVNLTGWVLPEVYEANLPCKVWSIPELGWHSWEVDFAYNAWKNAALYTFSGLFEHHKKDKRLIAYSISPAGKLSLVNSRQAYFSVTGLIVRALKKPNPSQALELTFTNSSPETFAALALIQLGVKSLFEKVRNRFFKPRWVLALVHANATPQQRKMLFASKGKEWADPFILSEKGDLFIFAEEIDQAGKGRIVAIDPENPEKSVLLFDHDFHMSYPFVLRDKGGLYMIPESSANRSLTLYSSVNFPYHWEKQLDIFTDFPVVDATFIKFGTKWWMFANAKEFAATFNEELHIFYAEELEGPWVPHQQNPVKNDARNTRPAGSMRIVGNKIQRPVQDCSWVYGQRMHWMEVEVLNESEFSERIINTVEADWAKRVIATHTINSDDQFQVLDAYIY